MTILRFFSFILQMSNKKPYFWDEKKKQELYHIWFFKIILFFIHKSYYKMNVCMYHIPQIKVNLTCQNVLAYFILNVYNVFYWFIDFLRLYPVKQTISNQEYSSNNEVVDNNVSKE